MSAPLPVSRTKPCPDCPVHHAKQIALKSKRCRECNGRHIGARAMQLANENRNRAARIAVAHAFGRRENVVTIAARPAPSMPPANHSSGAPTADIALAIRDGFVLCGPRGFDLHKNKDAGTYQAFGKGTPPSAGWTALTRHWISNDGRFQEAPLTGDGRFSR